PGGRRVDGRLEGPSRAAVVAELQGRGLAPVQVREAGSAARRPRRLPERRLSAAYLQLADLLRAGVPLLRGLRLLGRGRSDARIAAAMNLIAERVADGERLADAMREVGGFPRVHVAMVEAGERGGFLDDVLGELGVFLEHQAERRATVLGNLIYPTILLLVGLGIVVAALVFFVPRFEELFEGQELPFATRTLIGASGVAVHGWPYGLVLGIGLTGAWWFLRDRPDVRRRLAAGQLRLPIVGDLVRSLAVARFTRMLGTLLANGIPMLSAMRISRSAAGNPLLEDAIESATEAVGGGESLAAPLQASGLFGEDVIEMIMVGESANTLPLVLVGVARKAEKRTDHILGLLLKLMEPALLLLLAGAVVFIFLALVVPMMQLGFQV
ncbi:MAG: type II secretion system F family protein, partial [Planctomycetota bacterium]|nr:type II secretion system F family protein [Planctomycetota bacterium]